MREPGEMKVLLTGAAGFLGRNLLMHAPPGWQIVAVHRGGAEFGEFAAGLNGPHIQTACCDLADPVAVERLVETYGADWSCCIYLAAKVDIPWSVREPKEDLVANTLPLLNVLERIKTERMIYFSSGAVYDGIVGPVEPGVTARPSLPYAISKLASEHYVRSFHARGQVGEAVIVRFFGAYGPYEPERKIYNRLVRQFAFEREPRFTIRGDGRNLIDAMYVDDAVRAMHVLLRGEPGVISVDLASRAPMRLTELVQRAARAFGLEPEISYAGEVPEYIEFVSTDDRMLDHYGFAPRVGLEDGLHRFARWLAEDARQLAWA
jgi:nucleoside-diphosphate-sugar epimerase